MPTTNFMCDFVLVREMFWVLARLQNESVWTPGGGLFYLSVVEEWEGDDEARALALGAFDMDIALMRLGNPFANGQA